LRSGGIACAAAESFAQRRNRLRSGGIACAAKFWSAMTQRGANTTCFEGIGKLFSIFDFGRFSCRKYLQHRLQLFILPASLIRVKTFWALSEEDSGAGKQGVPDG